MQYEIKTFQFVTQCKDDCDVTKMLAYV